MSNVVSLNGAGLDHEAYWRMECAGPFPTSQRRAAYTLALEDMGRAVWIGAGGGSPSTLTVPPHAEVPLPIGASIIVDRRGAGPVTIVGATGVTIDVLPTSAENDGIKQGLYAVLRKVGRDRWTQLGNLTLT